MSFFGSWLGSGWEMVLNVCKFDIIWWQFLAFKFFAEVLESCVPWYLYLRIDLVKNSTHFWSLFLLYHYFSVPYFLERWGLCCCLVWFSNSLFETLIQNSISYVFACAGCVEHSLVKQAGFFMCRHLFIFIKNVSYWLNGYWLHKDFIQLLESNGFLSGLWSLNDSHSFLDWYEF